jgi:hypothetical protein
MIACARRVPALEHDCPASRDLATITELNASIERERVCALKVNSKIFAKLI